MPGVGDGVGGGVGSGPFPLAGRDVRGPAGGGHPKHPRREIAVRICRFTRFLSNPVAAGRRCCAAASRGRHHWHAMAASRITRAIREETSTCPGGHGERHLVPICWSNKNYNYCKRHIARSNAHTPPLWADGFIRVEKLTPSSRLDHVSGARHSCRTRLWRNLSLERQCSRYSLNSPVCA